MSGQSTKWREEQILIVCPGSRTTMAQLGCNELTPPAYRIPTRMFHDEETDEWRPYRTWKRKKLGAAAGKDEDEWEYVEDPDSDEGAVYPMEGGCITNMEAFLAFLEHVHGLLTTTYHNTPIVLMASPQWTRPDCEAIALYIFEKTRTPALCMINSALATQYGLKWPHMTVVDIGFEKVDVTCIYDSRIVSHMDVGYPAEPGADRVISGGEVFTQRLLQLLHDKGFDRDKAEQLKKSPICEVLPYAPEQPLLMELPEEEPAAPAAPAAPVAPVAAVAAAGPTAAAATTAITATTGDASKAAGSGAGAPAATTAAVDTDLAMDDAVPAADNDGVLDVAAIVTSGQTKEFIAKKEKEKTERGRAGRRAKDKEAEAAAARPVRLPNSKRARALFHFEDLIEDDEPEQKPQNQTTTGEGSSGAAGAAASTHSKAEGDGSEDGSEAEGEEMDEDEEEDGDGEGEEGDNEAAKSEAAPAATAATAETKTENATAPDAAVEKTEDAAAATKTEDGSAVKPEPAAGEASEKPASAPAEPSSAEKEDATMTDAPAISESETKEATTGDAAKEAPAAEAETAKGKEPAVEASSTDVIALPEQPGRRFKRVRHDYDIGLERFTFADRMEIDRIVATIYRTVQSIEEMYMRPSCWENLVFVGNGCRLRGLRENILQTLHGRHLIAPSTATMFTSELPSNMGTPSGTGAQTPTGSFSTPLPHQLPSSVNPLLQAATTASMGISGPGSTAGGDGGGHSHHFHAQTPTSIKLAALPTYLSEWTKNGFEEAMFLGAQVAARLAFCVHNLDAQGLESQRLMYLSRVDYNEIGPKGIRTHSLLG